GPDSGQGRSNAGGGRSTKAIEERLACWRTCISWTKRKTKLPIGIDAVPSWVTRHHRRAWLRCCFRGEVSQETRRRHFACTRQQRPKVMHMPPLLSSTLREEERPEISSRLTRFSS